MAGDLDSGLLHRLERYRLSTTAAHPLREGSTPGRRAPGKHLTLMASMAYSTWNKRPSGEKVFTPRSYSLLATAHIVSATQAPAPPRPAPPGCQRCYPLFLQNSKLQFPALF